MYVHMLHAFDLMKSMHDIFQVLSIIKSQYLVYKNNIESLKQCTRNKNDNIW